MERYEPQPGRSSLVARIEGSDPQAPSLLLMGHTDVVPVNPDGWSRDPFGAEIVDGFIWGRGAVDMLNETATMALAFRRLADSGFKPRGTLTYLAVADEEALGTWGAKWLVENERDAVYADYVLTESGGFQIPTSAGARLPVMVDEKGTYWSKLTVRGTPGHASQPFRTDNAVVTAAEVVRRLHEYRPPTRIHDTWRGFVEGMQYPPEFRDALLKDDELRDFAGTLPLGLSRVVYSCTHTTFAPTVIHGGTKTNVIPDQVDIQVDIRTLPGETEEDVHHHLREALGDLYPTVEIEGNDDPSTASPVDTPLWDTLSSVSGRLVRGLGAGAVRDGRRHRQPVLPPGGLGWLRVRPVQRTPLVRGLRHDVPRQRRAHRPGIARPVHRALGRSRQGPARLSQSSPRSRRNCSTSSASPSPEGMSVSASVSYRSSSWPT